MTQQAIFSGCLLLLLTPSLGNIIQPSPLADRHHDPSPDHAQIFQPTVDKGIGARSSRITDVFAMEDLASTIIKHARLVLLHLEELVFDFFF